MSVEAWNDLGRVTSDPVEVHVVEKIDAFGLDTKSESLLNTSMEFQVR